MIATTNDTEEKYIDSINDAVNYILRNIDRDDELLYQEKEVIKKFFTNDNYKLITEKDFYNFLNQLQQQKNNK